MAKDYKISQVAKHYGVTKQTVRNYTKHLNEPEDYYREQRGTNGTIVFITEQGLKRIEEIRKELYPEDDAIQPKKEKDSQIKSMWDELHARDQQMRTLIDSVNSVYRSMSLIEHRMNDIEANTKPDPGQPKRSAIYSRDG